MAWQGPISLIGPEGQRGTPGQDGEPGEEGTPGFPGLPGVEGGQGMSGPPGVPGVDGEPGEDAPLIPGPAGEAGAAGATGTAGADGAQGWDGEDGDAPMVPGPIGPTGPTGNTGATGSAGATGDTGPSGPQGQQGFSGDDGIDGETILVPGPTGATGSSGGGSSAIENLTLTASVAANALTIAIKTAAGADPSAGDPIDMSFRNATIATGDIAPLTLTAASSLVISSGSTMGIPTTANHPFTLWIVGFDDGGTFRLGAVNCWKYNDNGSGPYGTFPLIDNSLASSTAEGGAGGADSDAVIYTGTAVTTKAYRILGYMEWGSGLANEGTWDAAPTTIQLYGDGVPLPGDVVHMERTMVSGKVTGTTTIPNDDTNPQNTEGDQYMSLAITPKRTANVLNIVIDNALFGSSVAGGFGMALFQDSTAGSIAAQICQYPAASNARVLYMRHMMIANTTSSTTFNMRAGNSAAGTKTFCGVANADFYNGQIRASMTIEELQG